MQATIKTDAEIIREFLRLPPGEMPSAQFVDADDDGSPWSYLRDSLLPVDRQQQEHTDELIRLWADRDGWRDGIVVVA